MCSHMAARKQIPATAAAMSAHLDQRMPVGDGFSWICQHFTPVVPTERVRIIAHPTHSDDLIMAHPVGETARIISAVMRDDNILTMKREMTFLKCKYMWINTKAEI